MKIFYFIALIAAALYLFINLPKEKHRREPVAYWGCWAYLIASVIYWSFSACGITSISSDLRPFAACRRRGVLRWVTQAVTPLRRLHHHRCSLPEVL